MERLTKRNDSGGCYYPKCFEKCNGLGASSECDDCEIMTSVCEKLGEYEDLEEQCRLVKLPCKVGDIVYKPNSVTLKEIVEIKIESMFITESNFNISGRTTKMKYSFCCTPKDFGKTVFLTKSEAEAKLKELRGGENGR